MSNIAPAEMGLNTGLVGESVFTAVLSPTGLAASTTAEQAFNTGPLAFLAAGDFVSVVKPSEQAGLGLVGARAAAAYLYLTFRNDATASTTPTASELYRVLVKRGVRG